MRRTLPIVAAVLVATAAGCGGQRVPATRTGAPAGSDAAAASAVATGPALSPPLTRPPAGRTVRVGPLPDAIAADPQAHTFAVGIHDPSRLALVDSRTGRVRERVEVPTGDGTPADLTPAVFLVPAETGRRAVAVAPAIRTAPRALPRSAAVVLGRSFVTTDTAVDVLDRGRPTARLGTPATRPGGIAAADFDRALAVVSTARRTLELYDPRTLRLGASAPAGRGPTNVAAFGDLLFVADTAGHALLTFETEPRLHALRRTPLPGAPYALAVDPVRGELHVTLTDVNRLTTIDIAHGTLLRSSLPTVRQPDAVAIDSGTGTIAIAGHVAGVLQLVTAERRRASPARPARPSG